MITRIISAVVGIAVAIAVLLLYSTPVFNFAVSAITCIMIYEILSACKCIQYRFHSLICMGYAVVMPFLVGYTGKEAIYIVSTLCILMIFIGYIANHKKISFEKICIMLATTLLATLSMCCLVSLKNMDDVHGVCYIVLCLAGAWLGDSGAYFVGTFWGKHKLCPEISPKKTVEGAIGGVLTVGLVFAVYAFCYQFVQGYRGYTFEVNYLLLVLMGIVCGVLGILGDLSASLIKRQFGIKDFGNIMPGHGGIMDRFDSVLFVAPFMMFTFSHIMLFK